MMCGSITNYNPDTYTNLKFSLQLSYFKKWNVLNLMLHNAETHKNNRFITISFANTCKSCL